MNKFLTLCLALLQGCVAYAAAPGTTAFNTNQFSATGNNVAVKASALITNIVTKGVSIDAGVTDVPATTLTASGGIITASFTNAALYLHTLSADVELAISDTGSATNRLIYLDLYTDGVSSITWPVGAVLPATTNQPFLPGIGGKVSVLIERAQAPGGGITNYISWTPALIGTNDLIASQFESQSYDSVTITNELNVHGNIKGSTIVITNTATFLSNTYISNLYVTNINGAPFEQFWTNSVGTIQNTVGEAFDFNSSSAGGFSFSIRLEDDFAFNLLPSAELELTSPADSRNRVDIQPDSSGNNGISFQIHNPNSSVNYLLDYYAYVDGTNTPQVLVMGPLVAVPDFLADPSRDRSLANYVLGSRKTESSGNLLTVQNNRTNKFTVDYLGNAYDGTANQLATYAGITNVMTWALSDMTTALTTGTNKNYWYAPALGMTIKWVRATVALKSTSGTPTFDINEAGTSILSTKITIDSDEFDSLDATAPPVISDSSIAAKAKVDFDIDVAGTAAAGAQIQIGFTVP
jgi:hypothetical protein